MQYNITKLINTLTNEVGYLEKQKNCPSKHLYEKTGPYVGSDNWTKYWKDFADLGLANYQGSYYCIAALFWGMIQAFGLDAAQKLCKQKFMINCQVTYELFKQDDQVYASPKPGDIAVFWNGSRFHHAELVLDVKKDSFKTFGANTAANASIRNGGGCYAPKNYSLAAAQKAGHKFLRPDYGGQCAETWVKDYEGWKYQLSGGTFTKNQWKYIDNNWYFFNGSGILCTGWIYSAGQWYYCCPETGCMDTGWKKVDNRWYYLSSTGSMHTGWLQDKDRWYYLADDGSMATGWKEINGLWYVFDDSGCMISSTWFYDSTGNWYYLSSTGAMKTSQWIQQPDGIFYYLTNTGKMAQNAYIKDSCRNLYYYVDQRGVYLPEYDTETPTGNPTTSPISSSSSASSPPKAQTIIIQ